MTSQDALGTTPPDAALPMAASATVPVAPPAPRTPPTGRLGSVVVPAHQEADRVGACLDALADGWVPGELDVVVVVNGSTDGTADVARRRAEALGIDVRVVDLPEPGKAGALREGERLTSAPRLYLDADVRCSAGTVRSLLRAVTRGDVDVAVPRRLLDLSAASPGARLYHRTWQRLPWVQDQLAGRGAYCLSVEAAERFAQATGVLADDRLATTLVPASRTAVVDGEAVVTPAGTLREVLAVRRRVYAANTALARSHDVPAHDRGAGDRSRTLVRLARDPRGWPGLVLWVAVTAVAKAGAARAARSGAAVQWRRSRQIHHVQ